MWGWRCVDERFEASYCTLKPAPKAVWEHGLRGDETTYLRREESNRHSPPWCKSEEAERTAVSGRLGVTFRREYSRCRAGSVWQYAVGSGRVVACLRWARPRAASGVCASKRPCAHCSCSWSGPTCPSSSVRRPRRCVGSHMVHRTWHESMNSELHGNCHMVRAAGVHTPHAP